MTGATLGILALLPAMLGPVPESWTSSEITLLVKLCRGGQDIKVTIPRDSEEPELPAGCDFDACHAACSRKKLIERKDS